MAGGCYKILRVEAHLGLDEGGTPISFALRRKPRKFLKYRTNLNRRFEFTQ